MRSRRGGLTVFFLLMFLSGGFLFAGPPLLIAHRGASHEAPENTLAAFRLAWEQGADGIEGDFYLSKDGRIVCIHDKDTKRTAGKNLERGRFPVCGTAEIGCGILEIAKVRGREDSHAGRGSGDGARREIDLRGDQMRP